MEAQGLMRERQQLDESIAAIRQLEQRLTDNVELIAMGEDEDDADVVAEAEAALKELKSFFMPWAAR